MKQRLLDSFMNESSNNFVEYFEKQINKSLINREDYKKLNDKIKQLLEKHPNVQEYLENETICKLSESDMTTMLKIINIQEEIKVLELKESFKLGKKETYIFFNEMGMIKSLKEIKKL